MQGIRITTLLGLGLVAAGCGGDMSGESTDAAPAGLTATGEATPTAPDAASITREQLIEALGVTPGRDPDGVPHSDRRAGCYAFKIFARPEDNMAAYIEIGDPVVTNPSKTVGAVVGTYKGVSLRRCLRLFEQRLAKLG